MKFYDYNLTFMENWLRYGVALIVLLGAAMLIGWLAYKKDKGNGQKTIWKRLLLFCGALLGLFMILGTLGFYMQ